MKRLLICFSSLLFLSMQSALAAPVGDLVLQNASKNIITAQVSTFGKFNLDANERKNVSYTTLEKACSPTPTKCTAYFYVNDKSVGSATFNAVTGKLLQMNLALKVQVGKSQKVLRSVVIQ